MYSTNHYLPDVTKLHVCKLYLAKYYRNTLDFSLAKLFLGRNHEFMYGRDVYTVSLPLTVGSAIVFPLSIKRRREKDVPCRTHFCHVVNIYMWEEEGLLYQVNKCLFTTWGVEQASFLHLL